MMFVEKTRLFPLIILLVLFLIVGAPDASLSASRDEPMEVRDFLALMEMYDNDTGRFGELQTGAWLSFEDTVSVSKVNADGDTEVYLLSTGGSLYSPLLKYPGDLVASELKAGARARFTVQIVGVGENGARQAVSPVVNGIEVIREGRGSGVIRSDDIEVFGMKIPTTFLPRDYRTPLVRFLIVFTIWAAGAVVMWFVLLLASKMARKTRTDVDMKVLRIITGPFFLILLVYGLLVSLSQFDLDPRFLDILDMLYRAVTIILVAYISVKVFRNVIIVYLRMLSRKTETQADDVLVPVLGKVATVTIWIIAIVMFLRVFGLDITVFLGAMGIIGLVIAFAAQDTLSNFFSGVMILLDRPFKEGDWIQMEGSTYQVRDIGLRSTRLFHSMSNQIVTIPNNKISGYMMSDLSEPDFHGRKTVEVGVSYNSDPRRIGDLLLEIVRSHPDNFEDGDHLTFYRFDSFGDSAMNFSVTFWVKDYNDQWRVASEIRERIYRRFEEEGIEIPFPQMVVHMPGTEPGESRER